MFVVGLLVGAVIGCIVGFVVFAMVSISDDEEE